MAPPLCPRHLMRLALLQCLGLLMALPVSAQNIDIQHGRPAIGSTGLYQVEGPRTAGLHQLHLGLHISYGVNPLILHDGTGRQLARIVEGQLSLIPTAAWGAGHNLDVAASWHVVPRAYLGGRWQAGGFAPHAETGYGVGDLWLQAKWQQLHQDEDGIDVSFAPSLRIPSFAGHYLSDGTVALVPQFFLGRDWQDLAFVGNFGAVLRSRHTTDGLSVGSQWTWRAGVGWRLSQLFLPAVQVSAQAYGLVDILHPARDQAPSEWFVAANYRVGDWLMHGGAGRAITAGYGAPQLRVMLGIQWAPLLAPSLPPANNLMDDDHDGILNSWDKCPSEAESYTPPDLADGCPPPADADGDGVDDAHDACPDLAVEVPHPSDSNGCPTADQDHDGVPDYLDKCPTEAEDLDKVDDDDGCPELDADQDGLVDTQDACPSEAEEINGVNDGDGCPDVAETAPVVEPHDAIIESQSRVYFGVGTNELLTRGQQVLDQLAALLRRRPELKIRVEGYTDDQGSPRWNMRVAARRAAAVRQYLIDKGVVPSRIGVAVFGENKPRFPNADGRQRALNRRVNLSILRTPTSAKP